MENDLQYNDQCIIKTYNPEEEHFTKSSIDNELFCTEKFSDGGRNPYCPKIMRIDQMSYAIERYSFALGEAIKIHPTNIKRMFFTITFDELKRQIEEILAYLEKLEMTHRDFNPSNLIFYEKEKRIKLIDFYWCVTPGIEVGTPGLLNWFYGRDDKIAAQKILAEIKVIYDELDKKCQEEIHNAITEIGKEYFDGSSTTRNFLYHKIDIPMLKKTEYVVDATDQIDAVMSNITITPKVAIDIGCSVGSFTFNLMRRYILDTMYVYEGDPAVNNFVNKVKSLYGLDNLNINGRVLPDTEFPESDVTIMMNVHMWIYKQLGREQTDEVMRQLIKKSKLMFFQTAGVESPGMFTLKDKEFSNQEEIQKYLYSLGAKKVYYIKKISLHGGFRHLFKIEGR